MPSFQINDQEWETIIQEKDEDPLFLTYCSIRKYMDYETGVSGEKRKFNERYFIELLSSESSQGKKARVFDRNKVHRILKKLEKIGVVERIGPMVFFLPMASRDNQVSEKFEQKSNKNRTQVGFEVRTENTKEKITENSLNNRSELNFDYSENTEVQTEVRAEVFSRYPPRCEPPPVSGTGINNNINIDTLFDEFWKLYPKKVGKKAAKKSWIKNKYWKQAQEIMADMRQRVWNEMKFIKDPATYLNGECWNDEFKGASAETVEQKRQREIQEMLDRRGNDNA